MPGEVHPLLDDLLRRETPAYDSHEVWLEEEQSGRTGLSSQWTDVGRSHDLCRSSQRFLAEATDEGTPQAQGESCTLHPSALQCRCGTLPGRLLKLQHAGAESHRWLCLDYRSLVLIREQFLSENLNWRHIWTCELLPAVHY